MKTGIRPIFAAAALAGAFLLGGTAGALLMNFCRRRQEVCSEVYIDSVSSDDENDFEETFETEVNCDEK